METIPSVRAFLGCVWFRRGESRPASLPGKDLREPQGALQISHFVRDDKGKEVAQVEVVNGWEELQETPLFLRAAVLELGH